MIKIAVVAFVLLVSLWVLARPIKLPGVPYRPTYTGDEVVLGIVVAVALHLFAIGPFVLKALYPSKDKEEEKPLISRPVVQASLLKLGTPMDPKKLPDRVVPQQRTAPKKQLTASREDPGKKEKDAGAPPKDVKDDDLTNLVTKSDPFAEKGKTRPEEGHLDGVDGGQETDRSKVQAGDMYAAQLGEFFAKHLTLPSIITPAQESKLCSVVQITISRNMVIWHVQLDPVKSSQNELFDDAARTMLLKLRDDKLKLPEPPKEVEELYRGRAVRVAVQGRNGDPARCK